MHHFRFLQAEVNEEADEFNITLFNVETEGEITVTGKVSKTFVNREADTAAVESIGREIAKALNDASGLAGEALA